MGSEERHSIRDQVKGLQHCTGCTVKHGARLPRGPTHCFCCAACASPLEEGVVLALLKVALEEQQAREEASLRLAL